jgi:hypothetical protein
MRTSTHLVSVGKCALVLSLGTGCGGVHLIAGAWLSAGPAQLTEKPIDRISVQALNIRDVCEDGIDTLAPKLERNPRLASSPSQPWSEIRSQRTFPDGDQLPRQVGRMRRVLTLGRRNEVGERRAGGRADDED